MVRKSQLVEGRLQPADEGPVWLVVAPDDADRRLLVDGLKVDEHTLNSALDPDELARLEVEPEHVALILKRPKSYSQEDDFLFKVLSTGAFLAFSAAFFQFLIQFIQNYVAEQGA